MMQAALLLICSIVIGLGLSAWEMRTALSEQRRATSTLSDELLDLAMGGAANAAWSIDHRLAREVVSGIIRQSGVLAIEIRANLRGEKQEVLARLENSQPESNALVAWTAKKYFSDISYRSHILEVVNQNKQEVVGTIILQLSPRYAADKFLSRVYSTLTISLLEAFLMGCVLLAVAQWLVTAPLRRAATRVAQIGPETLDDTDYEISIPDLHKSDELGQLLNHTNQLLNRLVDSRKELRRLATRDPLTDLPNRTLIMEQLSALLATAQRASRHVAVIFLDLDRFKTVNDSLGHDIGDRLLQRVALTLVDLIRDEDSVGRLGGDEFLIVLPINEVKDAIAVVRRIIGALNQQYRIEEHSLRTSASLGIALFPEDGGTANILMRRADLAMYKAKSDPVAKWHLFSEDMSHALDAGMALEAALVAAIARGEIEIYLQPQFYAGNLELSACEALLRWKYNDQWIEPTEFIEIAETSGLILEIGDWVIAEACQIIKRWSKKAVPISVNVSGRQLADPGFVPRVLEIVKQHDVAPQFLVFEITETLLMHNLDDSHHRLTMLRNEGFRISIDDFGTGYSSLSYLTRLPIDELKIDRSFVSGSQHSSIVLSTIIAMGRALNIHVVAEGVETEAQRIELVESGCDLLQGYLLGRPVSVFEFESQFALSKSDNVYPITSG
jgi:diguanylate cyclase (GGDEF)-like protein